MGLCLENDCKNKLEIDEDYCILHLDIELGRETDEDEIYQINLNKYSEIYMNDLLKEFIKNKSRNIIENIINENNKINIKDIVTGYLKEDIIYDILNNIKINYKNNNIFYNTKSYKEIILNRKVLIFDKYVKMIKYPGYKLFGKRKEIWELYDIFNNKFKSFIKHLPYIGKSKLKNIKSIVNNNLTIYNNLYKKDPILYVIYSAHNIAEGIETYLDKSDISIENKTNFKDSLLVKYLDFIIICDLSHSRIERDRIYDKINTFINVKLKNF